MPCNARVVIQTKIKVDASEILKRANELGIPVREKGDNFIIDSGLSSAEFDRQGNAVLRYRGDSWDDGLRCLRLLASRLSTELGVQFDKVGEPETHIHDEAAPWQKIRA